ncbi:hypothetical protein JMUB3936_0355 [Leptotrichia wadei]|jgi:hypothetical protein|uniref:YqbQ/XkdQ domain-containing protein n=1 Tax=Leptotrichia wadei TaxID=157687 RepID=A0A510KS36_9FUSO|nr:hypothetical protein [Leptotrichia wadei]BBM54077.1 hypothetical protein JMUB3936_0355 [Leptotrichia wadei]DAO54422.1 MAG TPA: protein of unknown function (DUF5048) [Caudoviricetes sp.]
MAGKTRNSKRNRKSKKDDKDPKNNKGKKTENSKTSKKKKKEKKPIKASNVLKEKNKLEKTFTLTVPGIPILHAGDLVSIPKNSTGIAGIFEVKSVNHNFSQKYSFYGINIYFMSLTLELVKELESEE